MTNSIEFRREQIEQRYPVWTPSTITEHFRRLADDFPDRPMVLTDDKAYSYAEMVEWSRRLAKGLIALGLEPGDHVALVMANYPELVALRLAVAHAGGVTIPINTQLRRDELGYILRQSDASFLVTMDKFRKSNYLRTLDELMPGWQNGTQDYAPRLKKVVVFPTLPGNPTPSTGLRDLELLASSVSDAQLDERHAGISPESVVDIVYTSGTTGLPKGVMLTHDSVLRCSFSACLTRAMEDGRKLLLSLPLYHSYAYIEGFLAMSWVAGAIVPQLQFDVEATLAGIEKFSINEPLFVPTMTIAILEHPSLKNYDLSSVTAVMSAAAPAPVTLWKSLAEAFDVTEITTAYGQTELSSSAAYQWPEDPLEMLSSTVGRLKAQSVAGSPALSGRVAVYKTIDPLTMQDLAPGEEGEFVTRGPERMLGYYNKPEETAEVFMQDGWMRTGDLGYIRDDGRLVLTGRIKELYKCGGELVAPKEIEELLSSRPDISQAYVVGVPDERMGEVGCAFVVPAEGATWSEADLLFYCSENLARFKVPKYVIKTTPNKLPTTATGKIQKYKLSQLANEIGETRSPQSPERMRRVSTDHVDAS